MHIQSGGDDCADKSGLVPCPWGVLYKVGIGYTRSNTHIVSKLVLYKASHTNSMQPPPGVLQGRGYLWLPLFHSLLTWIDTGGKLVCSPRPSLHSLLQVEWGWWHGAGGCLAAFLPSFIHSRSGHDALCCLPPVHTHTHTYIHIYSSQVKWLTTASSGLYIHLDTGSLTCVTRRLHQCLQQLVHYEVSSCYSLILISLTPTVYLIAVWLGEDQMNQHQKRHTFERH